MAKRMLFWLFALFALTASAAYAAGSLTETITWIPGQRTKMIQYHWVGDAADGSVPVTAVTPWNGHLAASWTVPGATAPTAGYGVYLHPVINGTLYNTIDFLQSSHNNESATDVKAEFAYDVSSRYVYGPMSFSIGAQADLDAIGDLFVIIRMPE